VTTKQRKVTHSTFTIDRSFRHPPAKVWNAFATKEAKAKWFAGPSDEWTTEKWDLDFRIGGRETCISLAAKSNARILFDARYYDLLPSERLVYAYEMHIGDDRISVSLATIELRADGDVTHLALCEQGAFLDGFDNPKLREDGTNQLMDALAASLER
jgi:uncharacterized protein YndB with AHSA1/START domain